MSAGPAALPSRRIGDLAVSAVGLGVMPLSFPTAVDRSRAVAVVHAALEAGITLFDTADVYAPAWDRVGHNETLLAEALRTWSGPRTILERVVVATKGGVRRGPGEVWRRDGSAEHLRRAAEASSTRLGISPLPLHQLHRLDPSRTVADQAAALRALADQGLVTRIGVSNVTLPELEVFLEVAGGPRDGGIVSVQNERSPRYRRDADVLARCEELGIAYLPWSPLGGAARAAEVGSQYEAFADVGARRGLSPQAVAIAWHLASSPVTVPIPGTTRVSSVRDDAGAATVVLDAAEREVLDATAPEDSSQFPDREPTRPPLR